MQETIILQGVCNRIKGAFVENGHAMLTNQRFIYSKHSFAKIAVMGALVNLTKGDFDFDIPIADITDIEETKRLMSKVLVIRTQDAEYRFFFTKPDVAEKRQVHPRIYSPSALCQQSTVNSQQVSANDYNTCSCIQ